MAVLAGLTCEYLLNVGRTIRYLVDQYAESMTPEVSFCVDGGWVVGGVEPHVSDSLYAIVRAGLLVFLVFSSHLPFGGNLSFFPLAPIFSPPLPFPF